MFRGERTPPQTAQFCADGSKLAPPVTITVAVLLLYYIFLFFQTYSKLYLARRRKGSEPLRLLTALGLNRYRYLDAETAKVKYGNTHDPLALLGDRCVGNTLEQLPPFLISLWMYALIVDADSTWRSGGVYLLARAAYPFAFSAGSPFILLSTVPGYAVIWFHLLSCLAAVVGSREVLGRALAP